MTWLRSGRDEAALTYEELATRTEYSADTLARAASGRSVPQKLAVVLAYAKACGRNAKEAERLWKQARRDEARAQGVFSGHRSGVHISVVKDFADLHSAIVDLYQDDGSPPLRTLDARLGGLGRLPHSTVGRVLKGSSTPSRSFVAAFAEACNVRKADLPEWTKAWDRADADRRSSRIRSRKPGQAQRRLTVHDRITPRDLQLLMSELESSARKEPALKLLIHVPDPASGEVPASARMSRELLVDQAQRRGELACPQCRRPSFGYHDARGWTSELCASCAHPSLDQGAALRGAVPAATDRLPETRQVLRGPAIAPSDMSAKDTPTLSLRMPAPARRPPLPKRTSRTWPAPNSPSSAPPLGADSMTTLNEAPTARPSATAHPSAASSRADLSPLLRRSPPRPASFPDGGPSDWFAGRKTVSARPETVLTTRIRINIPAARPIQPASAGTSTRLTTDRPVPDTQPKAAPTNEDVQRGTEPRTGAPEGSF
ncbi:helix-turn-helix transcriptional regulator [Streptomyces sp. NPDC050997]|uniref:helix-turn-helix transcriptional regulator n=1 Tax=Streptomyces sp. NPDC050997 TaxID=3155519 RepID=UPI003436A451